jgi:hypothetical protein
MQIIQGIFRCNSDLEQTIRNAQGINDIENILYALNSSTEHTEFEEQVCDILQIWVRYFYQ